MRWKKCQPSIQEWEMYGVCSCKRALIIIYLYEVEPAYNAKKNPIPCDIYSMIKFKTPSNLRCTPLLKRDFQGEKIGWYFDVSEHVLGLLMN